jgi:hypothetical protein
MLGGSSEYVAILQSPRPHLSLLRPLALQLILHHEQSVIRVLRRLWMDIRSARAVLSL